MNLTIQEPTTMIKGEFMIDIKDYGFKYPTLEMNEEMIPARVVAVHRELYKVVSSHGETNAKLKASVYFNDFNDGLYPTVGDFVQLKWVDEDNSLITQTLPRKSCFSRRDPDKGRGEQAVSANFDYVFIMTSLNHDFNLKRIERYLTVAWQSGGIPVIILTKADLAEDQEDKIRAVEQIATGVGVFAVSAHSGYGLEALKDYLKPQKTIVFLGSSGVGKSSLVNALAGEDIMKVNGIRDDDSRGRHTTTHRQLVLLKNGVMIIDTPGMRELGMWDVSEGLGEAFTDVEELFTRCKFSDCTHKTEPGCAVHEAIASGELDEARYRSYLQLKNEAKYSDDKAAYLREKSQRGKDIAKWNRSKKKQQSKVKGR